MTVTADDLGALAAAGRFWWMRGEEFIATDERTPPQDGDVYLLDASPDWQAQWGGDWTAAADQINALLTEH